MLKLLQVPEKPGFGESQHVRKIHTAKRVTAGLLLSAGLALGFAGAASAQSNPSGPSGGGTTSTTLRQVTTTTVAVGSTKLALTGNDMWIPLAAGGGATAIALAARRASRRGIV